MAAIAFFVGLLSVFTNVVLYLVLLCLCVFAFLQIGPVLYSLTLSIISKFKPKNMYLRLISCSRKRVSAQRAYNGFVIFFIIFVTILHYFIVCTDIVINGYRDLYDSELMAISVMDDADTEAIQQIEGVNSVTLAAIQTLECAQNEPIRIWGVDCEGQRILKSFLCQEDWEQFCEGPDNVAMVSHLAYIHLNPNKDGSFVLQVDNREIEYIAWVNEDLLYNDVVVKLSSGINANAMFIDVDGNKLHEIKQNIRHIDTRWIVFEKEELLYFNVNVSQELFENIKTIMVPTIFGFLTIGLIGSAVLSLVKRKRDYDLLDALGYSKYRILALVNTEMCIYFVSNLPIVIMASVVIKIILGEILNTVYRSNLFRQNLFPDSLFVIATCFFIAFAILSFAVWMSRSLTRRRPI
ncbi:MAG: FtsX-like permease family protein [Clostridia bacterium]|nr:FtsX-like permease family protein [Clostridia bacterium]